MSQAQKLTLLFVKRDGHLTKGKPYAAGVGTVSLPPMLAYYSYLFNFQLVLLGHPLPYSTYEAFIQRGCSTPWDLRQLLIQSYQLVLIAVVIHISATVYTCLKNGLPLCLWP